MLKDLINNIELFKIYHPSSKIPGAIVKGPGNDPIALIGGSIVLLIIIVLIIYLRKRYKQKFSF